MVKPAPLGLAVLLGGCAVVGPNYHVPDSAMVKAPAAQGALSRGEGHRGRAAARSLVEAV
jgi:hypothetical protein